MYSIPIHIILYILLFLMVELNRGTDYIVRGYRFGTGF